MKEVTLNNLQFIESACITTYIYMYSIKSNKMYLLHGEISKIWKKCFPFYAELAALTASPTCWVVTVFHMVILLRV